MAYGPEGGEAIYHVHTDHLDTPRLLTDSAGGVVWRAAYDAYGRAYVDSSSSLAEEFNVRFPGQYYDEETGLHYNYHRYYDPSIGRYLSPDPIGQLGGVNLYTYSLNNPVNMIDPYGTTPLWVEVLKRLAKDVLGAKPVNEAETIDTDNDGIPDWQDGMPNYPGCCQGPWFRRRGQRFQIDRLRRLPIVMGMVFLTRLTQRPILRGGTQCRNPIQHRTSAN